jgi:hypothetical protein
MIKKTIFFSAILSTLALISCGGGGGGGSSVASTYTGQYIDSPVSGLTYTATPSGLTGTTNSSGNFTFQAGDTISFSIVTPVGNINAGSVAPATPTSTTSALPVSVLALANGTQIAQTLQSLASSPTATTIDVSGSNSKVAALSTSDITSISNYVSSGGSTTQPTVITVNAAVATSNAAASLSSISTSTTPTASTLSSILTGSTVFYSAVDSYKTDSTLVWIDAGVANFQNSGAMNTLCINGPIIKNTDNISFHPGCGSSVVDTTDQIWAIDSNVVNQIDITNSGGTSTTVTLPVLDSTTGLYNETLTISHVGSASTTVFNGNGLFYIINSTWPSFAGKTVTVSGNPTCSDGYMSYAVSSDGKSYTNKCKTGVVSGSTFQSSSGTFASVSNLPGVVQFTDSSSNKTTYIGMINGSSTSSGRFAAASLGDSTCNQHSNGDGNCGGVSVVSYTAQ